MKKRIALLVMLALLLTTVMPVSAYAADGQPPLISPAPTLPEEGAEDVWDEAAYLRLVRTEMGMPYPDGVNVSLNGAFLSFTAGRPVETGGRTMLPVRGVAEALDGAVSYDGGRVTIRLPEGRTVELVIGKAQLSVTENGKTTVHDMDAAPYETQGVTYVPVRFLAEALALEVTWDDYLGVAYLTDWSAFADRVDERFTALNAILRAAPRLEPQKGYRSENSLSVAGTLYGENSHSTATVSLKADTKMQGLKLDGSYELAMDLSALEEVLRPAVGEEAWALLLAAGSGRYRVRGDLSAGTLYAKGSNFAALTEDMVPNDTWVGVDAGMPLIPQEDYLALTQGAFTIGSLLADRAQSSGYYFYDESPWEQAMEPVEGLALLLDDSAFQVSTIGGTTSYVCDMDMLTLAKRAIDRGLMEQLSLSDLFGENSMPTGSFRLSAAVRGDKLTSLVLDGRVKIKSAAVEIAFHAESDGMRSSATFDVKGAYVGKIEVKSNASVTELSEAVKTAPDAGEKVVMLDELFVE